MAPRSPLPLNNFIGLIQVLQALYPVVFPEIPPTFKTRPERPPGALRSTVEAADYLCISPVTLRRLCQRKAITFVTATPSEYRFLLRDLDEYIASRRNVRKSGVKKLI